MAKTEKANNEDIPNVSDKDTESETGKAKVKKVNVKQTPNTDETIEDSSQSNEPDETLANADDKLSTEEPSADERSSLQDELAAERDKHLRLAAEYDNYRKRSAKEREMTYSDARIDAITKLLPVYDNLERALQMECADEAFYKGIEMIMSQFNDMFEGMGVRHIPAVGEPFDPNLHSAVMSVTDPNLKENTVVEEYQKGFTLGQRVIRFSTVVVAN